MKNPVLNYKNGTLFCEDVDLAAVVKEYGSPVFVYSASSFCERYEKLDKAFSGYPHLICYSVKTSSNLSILGLLSEEFGSGFDIVSGGELFRVEQAEGDTSKVAFAGVGKSAREIEYAIEEDILFFTVESEPELCRINDVAANMNRKARVAIRVNPDVDPKTHKYITTGKKESKFGVDFEVAFNLYKLAGELENIDPVGAHLHIGSQILSPEPHIQAVEKIVPFINKLKSELSIELEYLDIGGRFGICYNPEDKELDVETVAKGIIERVKPTGVKLVLEPGRYIAGPSGYLVTKVEYVKQSGDRRFVIVDSAMNDLLRPSLYQAYHHVVPVAEPAKDSKSVVSNVVGPICETGDFIALDREMPEVKAGDLLLVEDAGAYGFTMSSNYNSRCRAPEVLIDGDDYSLIRKREEYPDLISGEILS